MTRILLALSLLATAATAQAAEMNCNVESNYDLTIDARSVILTRETGTPKWVVIRGERLFVDDAWVNLGAADRKRLAQFDRGAREVGPQVAQIGREAADIAFIALGEVAAGLSDDPAQTRQRLGQARRKIDASMARSVTTTRFSSHALGEDIGEAVGEVVPSLVGDIVGGAVRAAMSGDTARLQALEGLDAKIEAQVQPRAKALEQRAEALCSRMIELDALEDALDYRLADGQRLDLLKVSREAR